MKIDRILVVLNPIAGGKDKTDLQQEIKRHLKGSELTFFYTTGRGDTLKLRKALADQKPQAVLAAGGDGTVHLAAKAIRKFKLPLAILPLGSGNGLSKDLGIPQDLAGALAVLQKPTLHAIDTLLVNRRFCIHVMDLGFNALVVKQFDKADTRGPGTYAKVALQEYLNFSPRHFDIFSDGGNFSGKAFMITVTNANQFGSNATVNPDGILNDGVFEICIIEPFPKAAAVRILYQLYNQTIHESVYTRVIRCTHATIKNKENELMQIDGEPVTTTPEIKVKVYKKSLQVLLPGQPKNLI